MVSDAINLIRTLISDTPRTYEENITVNNQAIIQFAHYPVVEAEILLDGNTVSGNLNQDSGVFEADTPMTGTLHIKYTAVWFLDKTIEQLATYAKKTINLVQVDDDKWVMEIPYYPLHFEEVNGQTITYDSTTNQFTCQATQPPQISGTFLDIYSTVGTLLLLKGSMPERIKRDFASFNDWGNYPDIAKGLQDQAMAWFKMSGEAV